MNRSDWQVTDVNEAHGIVFVEDLNLGRMTVTNDAENVYAAIIKIYGIGTRVVYRDSEGEQSEMIEVVNWLGTNIGFKPWNGLVWDVLSQEG